MPNPHVLRLTQKGDIFTIYSYVDEKIFPIKIKYKGIKNVGIRAGKFKCYLLTT